MGDQSVNKVSSLSSPEGDMGQKYLASGIHISMRLWESLPPAPSTSLTQRDYETVGFVIRGRANLKIEGQILSLTAGDSWVVPKGSSHCYEILEPFTAVEATTPPAQVHGRDEQG
jgi:mannose-6-phosphate isomerase-like protein (cupin superfamily)